jgi:hypothetical protein
LCAAYKADHNISELGIVGEFLINTSPCLR